MTVAICTSTDERLEEEEVAPQFAEQGESGRASPDPRKRAGIPYGRPMKKIAVGGGLHSPDGAPRLRS